MSEKQVTWIIVIGGLILIAFLYWISPWLLLSLPVAIFGIVQLAERDSMIKRNEELELKLKETEELLDSSREELSEARSTNRELRHQLRERENKLKELTRDPDAEIKQIELKAEQEITGGA